MGKTGRNFRAKKVNSNEEKARVWEDVVRLTAEGNITAARALLAAHGISLD